MKVYAVNTTTTGISEYTGWSPAGIVEHDGITIVAQDGGISVQAGADDNGVEFNWSIKTGATLIGDPSTGFKSIPLDYLSFKANGDFSVSITGERRGKLVEFTKLVRARRNDVLREEPVKLARGLTSQRFQRTMSGVDGSSIDMYAWTSLVVPLDRTK